MQLQVDEKGISKTQGQALSHLNALQYRCDTQMSREVLGLKRLSDAPELRLANIFFALNNSNVMKLSSKGSCVAILRRPALSLEPELPTSEDMVLQIASEFSSGSLCLTADKMPLDWMQPYPTGRKVAPCLVDMSSEQLQSGCSIETVVSTSAL